MRMERNGKKETKESEKKEKSIYQKPVLTKYRQLKKVAGQTAFR